MTAHGFLVRLLLWMYVPFLLLLLGVLLVIPALALASSPKPGWPCCFGVLALLLLVMTLVQLLVTCDVLLSPESPHAVEVEASPRQLEPLYRLTEDLTYQHGLVPPDEIRVGVEEVACVFEAGRNTKVLVVGGVALAALPWDALAGIVAHELAHFTAGDTRLGRYGGRALDLGDRFLFHPLTFLNPILWPVVLYQLLLRLAWAAASREQEYAADRWMVAHVGKEAAAAALTRLVLMEHMPWTNAGNIAHSAGASNLPLKQVFAEQWDRAKHSPRSDWEDAAEKAFRQQTKVMDSHPSLRDRLKAIKVKRDKALRLALDFSGTPTRELLPYWEELEEEISAKLIALCRIVRDAKMELAQIVAGRPLTRD